jgi:hypothetical protein
MNRTVTIDQTNILRYFYFISKEFYLIVVYLYLLCIHCQLCKLQLQWLAPNWCKGAVVTVYHTQLPLSNLNFVFIAVSIAATRFVIVVFDGGLVSSSDVRNIVILRVNLIKVTPHPIVINCHHPLVIVAAEQIYLLNRKMYRIGHWVQHLLLTTNPRPSCVYDASTSIQHVLGALFSSPRRTRDCQDTPML